MSEYWSAIRAALLALFVSGLIWIWAEGESLTSSTLTRVEIELPNDIAGDMVVRSETPNWTGAVQIRLEGSVREVGAAAAAIGQRVRLPAGLPSMPKATDGRKTLKLSEALGQIPELSRLQGVIAEVQPPEVSVRAVRMITRDLPVRVELAREVALDGDPVPTPSTVKVRLPEVMFSTLGETAQAVASLSDESLSRLRTDGPQSLAAPVRLPGPLADPDLVRITPDTVLVSLRPRRAVDTTRLPTVPVWFSLPPTEDGARWSVEILDKFLADVTVTGPSDDVKRVQNGGLTIKAVVELSTEDLERGAAEKGPITKQAAFQGVPGGMTCSAANATVRVKIGRRATPAAGGALSPPPVPENGNTPPKP